MENLLKRHFWVINVSGLAVIAFLLAGSINGFLGMKLAGIGRAPLSVDGIDGLDSRLAARLRAMRAGDGAGGRMDASSPFLIDEPLAEADLPEDLPAEEESEGGEEVLDPSYEVTKLPLKLLGTMVVWPTEYSSATMEVDRKDHKIVTPGFELLEGQATVQEIHRTYVVLKESSKLTIAPLWDRPKGDDPERGLSASADPVPPAVTAGREATNKSPQTADGVRRISDTSYMIERKMIDTKLKNLATLGQNARVVPNYHNGSYDGFRLIGMGSSSLFRDIGFTNGDIVKVINGNKIDSPNKALALYDALKNKSRLTVQLERGGMLKTMRFIVR